jgi:hypothetical protein
LRVAGEGAERTVAVAKRAELPAALRCAPGLWLDATGDERHYRALVGAGADLAVRRIEAKPVNYRLTQVVDRSFAKSRFVPREGEKEAGLKRRADSNIDRLARFILYASCLYRGRSGGAKDVLVIAPKKVREAIKSLLPDNVAALNFGKLRGIDEYRDVPCLIVVGREMPAMAQLELMTEALHWDNPKITSVTHVAEGKWPRAPLALSLADGRAVEIIGERHPDPNVAALQYEITGAEVEQALGRARLVQRTADNPCDVYLFGQTATRTPAHKIINWIDADRDLAEIMAAAGVIFAKGETIAQAFPGLLPETRRRREEAAAVAWQRGGQFPANAPLAPNSNIFLYGTRGAIGGELSPLPPRPALAFRHGEFRLAGEGRRATYRQPVLIDTARHSDPASAIAALLRVDPERVQWLGWRERHAAPTVPAKKNGRPRAANPSEAALKKRAQRAKTRAKRAPTA